MSTGYKLAEFGPGLINSEECKEFDGLGTLTREQKITNKMMCLENSHEENYYDQEILARSRDVGRKNATYSPLDKAKLESVKGTYL